MPLSVPSDHVYHELMVKFSLEEWNIDMTDFV